MNKIITAVFDGEVLGPHLPLELEPDKSYAIAIYVSKALGLWSQSS
ncbi:hypothetical protein [Dapis sp. BLCC M172]